MKLPKVLYKLPHIYRIISAGIISGLKNGFFLLSILIITAFLVLNLHTIIFPDNEEYLQQKITALQQPVNYQALSKLAQYSCQINLPNDCNNYFQMAQTLFLENQRHLATNQPVLGINNSPLTIYEQYKNQKLQTQTKLKYWQEQETLKPNYRDIYIQEAILSVKLGKYTDAKAAVNKALIIDPLYFQKEELIKLVRS